MKTGRLRQDHLISRRVCMNTTNSYTFGMTGAHQCFVQVMQTSPQSSTNGQHLRICLKSCQGLSKFSSAVILSCNRVNPSPPTIRQTVFIFNSSQCLIGRQLYISNNQKLKHPAISSISFRQVLHGRHCEDKHVE